MALILLLPSLSKLPALLYCLVAFYIPYFTLANKMAVCGVQANTAKHTPNERRPSYTGIHLFKQSKTPEYKNITWTQVTEGGGGVGGFAATAIAPTKTNKQNEIMLYSTQYHFFFFLYF